MRPVFQLILLLLTTLSAFAQTPTKRISGSVKGSRNEPLPGATVRLLKASDSALVQGVITNTDGKFEFKNLRDDTYRLHVTSVGNIDYRSGIVTVDELHVSVALPVFIVKPSKTTLNEVTVVAKKPPLEQDIDKTIVNVDAMIGSAGSNTLEVLEKTPGVTVSAAGDISLNGKAGVLVLIDGRQTYMSGQDLAAYLKSLPGGSLDKLELMTNPPARYDAAGSSIINIRLKRNTILGFTGNVTASYSLGVTGRSNDVINLNYNRKKINLFGGLGYNKDGNYSTDFYNRSFYNDNVSLTSSVQLQNHVQSASQGVMARLGMDYTASLHTIYGFLIHIQNRPKWENLEYTSRSLNERYVVDSIGTGTTDGNFRWKSTSANVNVQHKFDQAGRELTADLNYITYASRGEQVLQNSVNRADGTLLHRNQFLYNLPSDIAIYTAKTDYSHPLRDKAKLEAGLKSSVVTNDNNSQYFSQTGTGQISDYSKSNHFIYRENIHAAYVNVRKEWKRLAAQGGFRVENTRANGRQLGNQEVTETSFSRTYTSLFPTAFVSYKLDSAGSNTLTASIARRISRPNYQLLNPFLAYRDQYSFTTGNPYLKPQYFYQYELKYQHKQYVGIGVQYSRFTDVLFQMTQAVGDMFIIRPDNVARGYILAFVSNVSITPATGWILNANVTVARMALNGTAYSVTLNPGIYHARLNLVNQFRFSKGWSGELSGFYATKDLAGQTITDPRYRVAAAIQKKIIQDKGSIRITFEDIFHSWKSNGRTLSLEQAESFHSSESDTRRIGLTITYRFGKESLVRKRNHTDNAADAEKGRVD